MTDHKPQPTRPVPTLSDEIPNCLPDDPPICGGKTLHCSFCHKSKHEVRKLIAGPSAYICDECVDLFSDILDEQLEREIPLILTAEDRKNIWEVAVREFPRVVSSGKEIDFSSFMKRSIEGYISAFSPMSNLKEGK